MTKQQRRRLLNVLTKQQCACEMTCVLCLWGHYASIRWAVMLGDWRRWDDEDVQSHARGRAGGRA